MADAPVLLVWLACYESAANCNDSSSLDDIAKASGTSKALSYEHFDSKRALHETLITEHAEVLFDRVIAFCWDGMKQVEDYAAVARGMPVVERAA